MTSVTIGRFACFSKWSQEDNFNQELRNESEYSDGSLNQQWTMTGIDVASGQRLQFDVPADNTIGCNRRQFRQTLKEWIHTFLITWPDTFGKACALIGRINNGAPSRSG